MKERTLPLRVDSYWTPPKIVDADNDSLELEEAVAIANGEARRAEGLEQEVKNTIALWQEALRDRDHFRKQALKAIGHGHREVNALRAKIRSAINAYMEHDGSPGESAEVSFSILREALGENDGKQAAGIPANSETAAEGQAESELQPDIQAGATSATASASETPEQIAVRIVKAWKRSYQDHVEPTVERVTEEAEIVRDMLRRHGVEYQ